MPLRTLFTCQALLALTHGVGFIVTPGLMLALYQVPYAHATALMAQQFGTSLLGVLVVSWQARSFTDPQALHSVVLAGCATNTVGAALVVLGLVTGVFGPMGWLGVVLQGALAAGFWRACWRGLQRPARG